MGLDIRWPIGIMFTFIGALMSIFGAFVKSDHAISLGINVNLVWGAVLLVFGVLMLFGALKGGKNKNNPPSA